MLSHLHIQNYALISYLDLDLADGFSVLTGETGAGKSIILGALSLVMGARADTKVITEGEERCTIEATFTTADQGELIIRRELNQSGRSRSFVNDEVVTQAELKALANQLIDIHSQHESLLIGDDLFQISVVDAIANNTAERTEYATRYQAYLTAEKALHDLETLVRKTQEDADYVAFQYQQLDEAHLENDELEALQDEEFRLLHAGEIKEALLHALADIDGESDCTALNLLRDCNLDTASPELGERLHSVVIELKDIAEELQRTANHTEVDPERLEVVQERLDLLQTLLGKHHVQTIGELIALRNQLGEQMQRIASFDDDIAQLIKERNEAATALAQAADTLTKSRLRVTDIIAQHLIKDMSGTRQCGSRRHACSRLQRDGQGRCAVSLFRQPQPVTAPCSRCGIWGRDKPVDALYQSLDCCHQRAADYHLRRDRHGRKRRDSNTNGRHHVPNGSIETDNRHYTLATDSSQRADAIPCVQSRYRHSHRESYTPADRGRACGANRRYALGQTSHTGSRCHG